MLVEVIVLITILLTSLLAVFLPIVNTLSPTLLFIGQHFGSGVILATGLVHLLQPAAEALENVTEFPLAYALCLGMILIVTLGDGLQRRSGHHHSHDRLIDQTIIEGEKKTGSVSSVIVLESGMIFHSVFIGISVVFAETNALAVAVVIHQVFEGIGLGSRLASIQWNEPWKPKALAWAYALATPLGILIGLLGANNSPVLTGVFDALSAGVLLYTGLVELVATELMGTMLEVPLREWIGAYTATILGAATMTALANWI